MSSLYIELGLIDATTVMGNQSMHLFESDKDVKRVILDMWGYLEKDFFLTEDALSQMSFDARLMLLYS